MATKNIGGSITLEGASKYNSDLKMIKSNLTVLRSEMKLANSENKESMNTTEALTKKGELLGKMYTEVSKKVETYGKMYDDAAKKQKEAADSINKYEKELKEAEEALEKMKKEGTATDQELEKQQKVVNDLNGKLQKSEKAYESAGQKMNQYKTAGNNAKTELTNLDNELKKNDKYLKEAKNSTDGTAKSIDHLGKETQETKQQLSVFGDVLKANLASEVIVSGVRMLANGMKNVAKAAYDAGASFDAAMSKVQAVSGASSTEIAQLEAKAKEMGATTVFSATESAEALNYMAMAGWKTDQMLSGLPGIMNLAAASGESLARTSDIVTDALTAFGLSAEDSGHFADILAQASSNANTNVGMMGETFKYCAPVAGALSMDIEDVAVGIGLMANAGIKASQAGTSLRRFLLEMGGDIKICSDRTGEMVVHTENADGTMRTFADIIVDLREAFSGLTDAEKKSNAQTIVGKNAVSGFLAMLNASQADFDKLTDSIENADGAAARMAAIMNDNLKGDVTIMNSALEGLAIAFEDCFDDSARTSVQGATEVIGKLKEDIESGEMGVSLRRMGDAFEDLSKRTLEFAESALPGMINGLSWMMDNGETIISVISGMITAQLAQKTVTPIVMACQAAYTALTTAEEGATIATTLLNTAMNANPIGLIVTALGFAAGAFATYSALAGDATTETDKFIEKAQGINESLADSAARRKENAAGMEAEMTLCRNLSNELMGLQEKTSLTTEEQWRQKEIVDQLNAAIPDLNIAIDEQTGKLDDHSKAVLSDMDALVEYYKVLAAQEDLKEITQNLYDAEKNLYEIENQLTDARQHAEEVSDHYYNNISAGQDAMNKERKAVLDAKDAVKELEQAQKDATDNIAGFKDELANTESYLNEHTDTVKEAAAAEQGFATAVDEAADTTIQRTEDQIKELEKFQDAVAGTVTGVNPLFGELKSETDANLSEITANLEKNAEAAEHFSDALTSAMNNANYGTSTEYTQLVNLLAEKGPEATGLLEELAAGAETNSQEFVNAMSSMRDYLESESSITAVTEELVDTLGTHYTAATDTVTTGEADITTTLQNEGKNQTEAVETTMTDIQTATEEGIKNMEKAVTDNAPLVTMATETMAKESFNSIETVWGTGGSKFKELGTSAMKQLAAGIKAGEGDIKNALQLVLQNSVDTMDLSGFVSRINKALGASLER